MEGKERVQQKFYILFGMVFAVAILTPHLTNGHLGVPAQYVQSVILAVDFGLAYAFYLLYKKEKKEAEKIQADTQKDITLLYRHIGRANTTVGLLQRFSQVFSFGRNAESQDKEDIFYEALRNISVSAAQSEKCVLRFVQKNTKKTLKEYLILEKENDQAPNISNNAIDGDGIILDTAKNEIIFVSRHLDDDSAAILWLLKKPGDVDRELIQSLLVQIHIFYIAVEGKNHLQTT